MQQRRHDLERKLPLRPQTSEKVEYDQRLADRAEERRYGREEEEAGKKKVGSGVYAVEDDGYMREEFADNVESTCHIIRSAQPNRTHCRRAGRVLLSETLHHPPNQRFTHPTPYKG